MIIFLKSLTILFYIFDWLCFIPQLLNLFPINNHSRHCAVTDAASSNIRTVLLVNLFANEFIFEDFYVHHKDLSAFSGGTNKPMKLISLMYNNLGVFRLLTFHR